MSAWRVWFPFFPWSKSELNSCFAPLKWSSGDLGLGLSVARMNCVTFFESEDRLTKGRSLCVWRLICLWKVSCSVSYPPWVRCFELIHQVSPQGEGSLRRSDLSLNWPLLTNVILIGFALPYPTRLIGLYNPSTRSSVRHIDKRLRLCRYPQSAHAAQHTVEQERRQNFGYALNLCLLQYRFKQIFSSWTSSGNYKAVL